MAQPAAALASYTYNVRAIPVLSYVAQLCFLPPNFAQVEWTTMQTVLRTATNAFSHSDFFALPSLGDPALRSASATAYSAIFRTAHVTLTCWKSWKHQLIFAAQESLPFSRWGSGLFYPDFWDSSPLALNLDTAYKGFVDFPRWSAGGLASLSIVTDASPPFPDTGSRRKSMVSS